MHFLLLQGQMGVLRSRTSDRDSWGERCAWGNLDGNKERMQITWKLNCEGT